MENPPLNYNPNDSLLQGGIDSSITKVMGGGGAPDGYNETQSLLDIEGGRNIPIEMIKGGASNSNSNALSHIQIVKEYGDADENLLNKFIENLTKNVDKAIQVLKREKEDLDSKFTFLNYKIINNELESSVTNSRNTSGSLSIVFVPLTTKTLIILPPINTSIEYLQLIQFLISSDNIIIEKDKLKLRRHVFLVSLTPFNINDKSIEYLYLSLKVNNYDHYFVVNEPHAIIYPKEIDGSKGIFITSDSKKLSKPLDSSVEANDFESIQLYGIKRMKYKFDRENIYDDISFSMISNGDVDPDTDLTDYNFTLQKNIAILTLIDEDIKTIIVDMLGEKFRIRLPVTSDAKDRVYSLWQKGKYNKDEKELIKHLGLSTFDGMDIPQFLFSLTYYKCFNDINLLTKQECAIIRSDFERIYLNILKQNNITLDEDFTIDTFEYTCNAVGISPPENIRCEIQYAKPGVEDFIEDFVEIPYENLELVKANDDTSKSKLRSLLQIEINKKIKK